MLTCCMSWFVCVVPIIKLALCYILARQEVRYIQTWELPVQSQFVELPYYKYNATLSLFYREFNRFEFRIPFPWLVAIIKLNSQSIVLEINIFAADDFFDQRDSSTATPMEEISLVIHTLCWKIILIWSNSMRVSFQLTVVCINVNSFIIIDWFGIFFFEF